jgi:ribosome-binding protein aMBF1 (putative translation factor)
VKRFCDIIIRRGSAGGGTEQNCAATAPSEGSHRAYQFFSRKAWRVPAARQSFNDEIKAEVARLLSQERQRQRISMNMLAAKAGLSQSLISSFETTKWNPTLESLLRISAVLDVNLGDVIKRAVRNVGSKAKD